jgi:hypothetical protein
MLGGLNLDEWASARMGWIDMSEAVMVFAAGEYKTVHTHFVTLVPRALEILHQQFRNSVARDEHSRLASDEPIRFIRRSDLAELESIGARTRNRPRALLTAIAFFAIALGACSHRRWVHRRGAAPSISRRLARSKQRETRV